MKDYILPLLLIALIILAPDGVTKARELIFDERENEGKIAFVVTDYSPVKEEEKSEDCECGGTGQIRTGDGRILPCPCGPDCKCKKKAGQVPVLLSETPYDEYYYIKLTAGYCAPCKKWDRDEKPKLKAVGLDVVEIDIEKNPQVMRDFGVTTIPTFIPCIKEGKRALKKVDGKSVIKGNLSGEDLIKNIDEIHKSLNPSTTSLSPRYSVEELDAIVRSSYGPNTPLNKAIMGDGSDVYIHLYRDHGFTKEQVVGLEYWVALALHDATHEPASITPWRN